MRTLIVDNHDSFTYNLCQLVGELTGVPPVVLPNDTPAWTDDDLHWFDNVIVSPGPGRPSRPADLGISRGVVAQADVPLLGVCLGFQALCEISGARVALAPEPRHGLPSAVTHDGRGLFAGIPAPFQAIRYHSLAVFDLPSRLRATAWADDGVLMAVEDLSRPAYGVQFHPESIRTECGRTLVGNFLGVVPHESPARARPVVEIAPVREAALKVHVERLDVAVPPEDAYAALFRDSPRSFWLDSNLPGHPLSQVSMMGDAQGPLGRTVSADVFSGTVTVSASAGTRVVRGGFFDWLDADLRSLDVDVSDVPGDFGLGWVGYLGYELKAECGGERVHRSEHPDALMLFADRALVFAPDGVFALVLAVSDAEGEAAARVFDEFRRVLASACPSPSEDPPSGCLDARTRARHDRDSYLRLVAECLEAIRQGESYEICLTNRIEHTAAVDPWLAYRRLRKVSPAPYSCLLRFDSLAVLSSSPERFLHISPDGVAESRPIKGTRPRGHSPAADAELRRDLATNVKDRAENLMIVDLLRNDLGRVAATGTVEVPSLFAVESFATVHQLVSTIRAQLRKDVSPVDCVRAAFPGGSMAGAPKIRTMAIIDTFEGGPRGVYSGAIGYFSPTGAVDLSIAIRTLVVTGDRTHFGTGGAVVALSDPTAEYAETADKAAALLTVLGVEARDVFR